MKKSCMGNAVETTIDQAITDQEQGRSTYDYSHQLSIARCNNTVWLSLLFIYHISIVTEMKNLRALKNVKSYAGLYQKYTYYHIFNIYKFSAAVSSSYHER